MNMREETQADAPGCGQTTQKRPRFASKMARMLLSHKPSQCASSKIIWPATVFDLDQGAPFGWRGLSLPDGKIDELFNLSYLVLH
jgi:hypothetical protein